MRPTQIRPRKRPYLATFGSASALIADFDAMPCHDLDRLRASVELNAMEPEEAIAASLERWADRRFR
jgi:hypothetical protein